MSSGKTMGIALLGLVALLGLNSLYTVNEGQRALVLRLGQLEQGPDGRAEEMSAGLHIKWPLLNQIKLFDTRLQTLDVGTSSDDTNPPRIVTLEKKNVIVDYFVKWRINNVALFYTRTGGNYRQAQTLLMQQINDGLRAEFGRRTINEVVSDDRTNIMERLRTQANSGARGLGVEVVDVRIKRIDLPEEVSSAIFDQMRAEREQVAAEHRAQGKADAETIRAKADASVTVTVATAKADSEKLRGEGNAVAAKIYADAYNKDPEFYAFYRSLLAYRNTFSNKEDILVLKPDSQFFKYFRGDKPSQKTSGG